MRLGILDLKIIENVHRLNEVSQHEFAREIGVAQPTVFYHIRKLRESGILIGERGNFSVNRKRLEEIFEDMFGDGIAVTCLLLKLLLAKAEEEVTIRDLEKRVRTGSEVDKMFAKEHLEDSRKNLRDIADAMRLLLDVIDTYDEDTAGMLYRRLFELEARGLIALTERERVFATMMKIAGFAPFVKDERRLKAFREKVRKALRVLSR